ncbi:hypothetical protein MNBD_IGNAVI01-255 [hydrothermal vent metagenome]|uniref:Transporter n=1 Tax=hydrothermal vent metagenome TaxID=652676 RepID=A0A3B1CT76_9ZZZZ
MKKLIIIFFIPFVNQIYSQACCTAGSPLLSSLETSATEKGNLLLGISYVYNLLDDVYDETFYLDDQTRNRISKSILLQVDYGITGKISISGLFTYINQERNISAYQGFTNTVTTSGIGDAVLLAKYNVIPLTMMKEQEFSIGGGTKIPLGKSDLTSNGVLLPADMQPGTGSWDFILWSYFSQGRLFDLPLNLVVNLSYRMNGTNKRFGSNNGTYKFGNELITQGGLGYRTDLPVDFTLFTRLRITDKDEYKKNPIPNTGGTWLYIIPGINVKLYKSVILRLTSEIPIYRNLQGTQLTTTFVTSASIYYTINDL